MNKSIDFDEYLDKVKGCFLGKTVIGTLGAPFEGVKMPMDLKFKPEMVNTMLPNDDLDLQVLWLEVVEKYGLDFTSSSSYADDRWYYECRTNERNCTCYRHCIDKRRVVSNILSSRTYIAIERSCVSYISILFCKV